MNALALLLAQAVQTGFRCRLNAVVPSFGPTLLASTFEGFTKLKEPGKRILEAGILPASFAADSTGFSQVGMVAILYYNR